MTTPQACAWTVDPAEAERVWRTTCGQEVVFSDDSGPWRNGMQFCSYCGKPLEELHTQADSKDE